MPEAGIGVLHRGPVTDERVLSLAEAAFVATHESEPWSYPEPVLAQALIRFRRQLASAGAIACAAWHLPHGLRFPNRPLTRGRDPTLQPGASIVSIAHSHRISHDTGARTVGELARPAADGSACLMALSSLPAGRQAEEFQLWSLTRVQPVAWGFMLLPDGAALPRLLDRLGWRRSGHVLDELSGLRLAVHQGPTRGP